MAKTTATKKAAAAKKPAAAKPEAEPVAAEPVVEPEPAKQSRMDMLEEKVADLEWAMRVGGGLGDSIDQHRATRVLDNA